MNDADGNSTENRGRVGNDFPDFAWVPPFVMIGAMFGSLPVAGPGFKLGHQIPFGQAVIGALLGMSAVGINGRFDLTLPKPDS